MTIDIIPFVDPGLGNSSYMVGLPDQRALVIDPRRDPSTYLHEAEVRGWDIVAGVETHLHADFISGGRELQAVGAALYAPAGSELAFAHRPLEPEGDVTFGGLTLKALPSPGHTPEHLSYLLSDGTRPLALFSGGSLLVGAVARTDLIAPDQTEELTRQMFRSMRDVLAPLPDDLAVFPTHGAGSFCSAGVGGDRVTTMGRERATNPFLRVEEEDQFVKLLLANLGTYPVYYGRLRERNRIGPRVYGGEGPRLAAIAPDEFDRLRRDGATVVDVRPAASWAGGHLPGSLSIPLRDEFALWLGWLVDIDDTIIFVAEGGQDRPGLVRACLGIGFENLAGELAGGTEAWSASGRRLNSTARAPIGVLDAQIIDVRQSSEWETGHIPGVLHAELGDLAAAGLPSRSLAVHCGRSDRASTAASVLERAGRTDVTVLIGGPEDWSRTTGRPLEVG
ncbi:MAG TPA: rhodanese-like domain-containing protein [Acidimicrobiia bacterium]|nr:rhodanese-like domain-containing protein [Acidimicrobiia bacterium]